MAPLITSIPMWLFFVSRWTLIMFLEPLQQTRADRKSANETWALTQEMAVEYCSSFFEAMSSANLQWNLWYYFPIPPVVVKTRGASVPRSTSRYFFPNLSAISFLCAFATFPPINFFNYLQVMGYIDMSLTNK